jgi:hypothetical protein
MRISKIEKETKYWSVQKNFYFASLRVIRRGGTAGEEIPFFGEPLHDRSLAVVLFPKLNTAKILAKPS